MFYAHFVLSKKGPLAKIWLAAHWDKKLTKAHVFETNIDSSVEAIIEPKVKMALRTSGHLLLGVVRIYSRKAKYLLADCNEAFVKIKMAFRPGVVDMPEENREAAVATITLPETFHDFDTTMADLSDIDVQAQFSVNQSRPEEITMREDLGNITLVGDDGFGDMGFDDRNMIQDAQLDDSLYKNTSGGSNIDLDDVGKTAEDNQEKPMDIDFEAQARNDGFGETLDDFDPPGVHDDDSDDNDNFGDDVDTELFGDANFMGDTGGLFEEPQVPPVPTEPDPTAPEPPQLDSHTMSAIQPPEDTTQAPQEQTTMSTVPDQTTLVPNEAEAFALEPLDITTLGTERKSKRKRKLIVDEQKGIASETMKMQLSDTSEIVTTLDLAPPTKKLMHWKETGGVEKLFALPGRPIASKRVGKMFQRNLVTRSVLEVDQEDDDRLELEQPRDEEESRHQDIEPRHSAIHEPPPSVSVAEEPSLIEPVLDASRQSTNVFDASVTRQSNVFDSTNNSVRQSDVFEAPPSIPQGRPEPGFQIQDEPAISMPSVPPPIDHSDDEDDFAPLGAPSPPSDDDHEPLPPPEDPEPDEDDLFSAELPDMAVEEEQGEEPQTAEEAEEQEERRWNKRTQQLLHYINKAMDINPKETASFHSMLHRNNRKQVASKFYTLLVLKKQQSIDVMQEEPYGDIILSKGARYEVVV